jgi:hypothetical protein
MNPSETTASETTSKQPQQPQQQQQIEWRTTFRAGLFAWPSLRREIEHACVAGGVTRRQLRVRWRGFAVHVDIVLAGDDKSVRRMARFIDDLAAQA